MNKVAGRILGKEGAEVMVPRMLQLKCAGYSRVEAPP
jgi:hypothetical protein